MRKKSISLGHQIIEALTLEQIESLIDAIGSETLLEKIESQDGFLDIDVVSTVRNVVMKSDLSGNDECDIDMAVVSDNKLVREWNSLWQRWAAAVAEVGDENGAYAMQEHHWEPAYFDGSALTSDLENIATEMAPKIDRVYDLINDPALFTDALAEIEDSIRSYPEWMGVCEGDGCTLGYHTTRCILQWIWIGYKDHDSPGSVFLAKIGEIESLYTLVNVDPNAVARYIIEMDSAVCREIYELMAGGLFQKEQENIYSPWNTIMLEFKQRYDKEAYYAQCVRDLGKNWHLGLPLVEKAITSKDWNRADSLLLKTFASHLCHDSESDWFPETSLLISNRYYYFETTTENDLSRLFQIWGDVSEKLGNRERSVASRLQGTLVHYPGDIDAATSTYTSLRKEYSTPILDKLFRQWQDEIAMKSFNWYHAIRTDTETWIHWAIEAQVESDNGAARFREQLDRWLCGLSGSKDTFIKHWKELAILTVDLSTETQRNGYRGLFTTAFENLNSRTDLDTSRKTLVGRLCCAETVEKTIDIWKKHFSCIIPDPSASGSDYQRPVAWIKVLLDLNPQVYSHLVEQWKVIHRRKRNLWMKMRSEKLPVD